MVATKHPSGYRKGSRALRQGTPCWCAQCEETGIWVGVRNAEGMRYIPLANWVRYDIENKRLDCWACYDLGK